MKDKFDTQESHVLRTVVDLHVREGAPISSLKIKEAAGLAWSTATIRNILSRLEEKGYVVKPHPSAGRVPTDEGYRVFVDSIEEKQESLEEFAKLFRKTLKDNLHDISVIMSRASRLLGSISKNFAVVYGTMPRESQVCRINLLPLEGSRMLVVVTFDPEFERTTVLRMEKKFSSDVVASAEALINQIIVDRTLEEAKDALDNALRDNITDEGIITREVAINRETIFSGPPAVELYFEERDYLLEESGHFDPELLQLLLHLLNNKEYLTSILSSRLWERTTVTIGSEHEEEMLKRFSLVTAGYRMGGARGVLGIIGPTRMHYELSCYLVSSFARELRALGEEYFQS